MDGNDVLNLNIVSKVSNDFFIRSYELFIFKIKNFKIIYPYMKNEKNIYVQKRLASFVRFQAQKHENH